MDRSQGIHRIGRAAALDLQCADLSPASPPTASRHIARRCSRPGSSSSPLWGALCAGISSTRSKPSSACAWRASARCPRWGGLNVPPRMPIERDARASPAPQARTCPSPSIRYLNVHSSRSPIGPARVQLLRRVADLRAHPELAAVGEARRGVHVHAGRVHAQLKGPRALGVRGHDRLGMPAPVAADVLDRLLVEPTTLTASVSARYSVPQSSSRRRRRDPDARSPAPRVRSSPRSSTPASPSARTIRGTNSAAIVLVDQQRLGGVAHPRALRLRVQHDRLAPARDPRAAST